MILKNKDPFGGVHGESESTAPSPFRIDKDEALKEIQKSLDIWDEKKIVKNELVVGNEQKFIITVNGKNCDSSFFKLDCSPR